MRGNSNLSRGRGRNSQRDGQKDRSFRGRGSFGQFKAGRNACRGRGGSNNAQKGRTPALCPRLAEVDVGITVFISKHSSFSGVIKERYSDFQVNEIDCDGNIVKLTHLDIPNEECTKKPPQDVQRHELIPEEIWVKLINMTKTQKTPTEEKESAMDSPSECIKEEPHVVHEDNTTSTVSNVQVKHSEHSDSECSNGRTALNLTAENAVDTSSLQEEKKEGENLTGASESITPKAQDIPSSTSASSSNPARLENMPDNIELDVTSLDKNSRRAIHMSVKTAFKEVNSNTIERDGRKYVVFNLLKDARQDRRMWPKSRSGKYLYFVLHKKNMDTSEAINAISKKLRLKPGSLTFAGTKDKRAITSQLVCLSLGEPSRLFTVSKTLFNVVLGNYQFKERPLRLGDLKGNQFRIALRNVHASDDQINAGMNSLKENGFINYFGLQRFGANISAPTHAIGKALLLGEWKKAVDLILQPRETFPDVTAALNEWKTSKDPKAALQKLKAKSTSLEALLLQGLADHGSNDIVNALSSLPRNTRSMYLHAYQSLIWNKTVSYRIKEYGLKPIVGDLVLLRSGTSTKNEGGLLSPDDELFVEQPDVQFEGNDSQQEVRCISEADLDQVAMGDIVLPLPGYSIIYPQNSVGDFMMSLLKEDGLSSDSFKQTVKQYSVKGTYRRIVAQAEKLEWKIIHYKNPQTDFILSDFEEMQGKKILREDEDCTHKAVVFSMCLEPSTYATMAIREITKEDTSATTQVSMSASASNAITSIVSKDEKTVLNESGNELKRQADTSAEENVAEKRIKQS